MEGVSQANATNVLFSTNSEEYIAERSGTAAETVQGFESRGSDPKLSTLNKWRRALEAADGAGELAIEPRMTLGEIERWIAAHIKPKR